MEIAGLVLEPSLLLDELFSDRLIRCWAQKIISIWRAGIGILVTDHNVRETLAVTDRAYIITMDGSSFRTEALGNDPEVRRVYLENFNMELQSGAGRFRE